METPSSTRRVVTRSQTLAAENNNIPMSRKIEDSEKGVSNSSRQRTGGKQQDRSVLIDITNDSPIVGLAMGSFKTPSSSSTLSKKRINSSQAKHKHTMTATPGSGEALLRGQVKTLLQKVEEEAELSKLSLEHRPFLHHLINSPLAAGILAPTPANTPQVLSSHSQNESFKNGCLASVMPSPVQKHFMISQMVAEIFDGKKQESPESEKSLITRSLLVDFSEKSEGSDSSECSSSSVLTQEGGTGGESEGTDKSSMEDDDASVWSIQVNASARDDHEEEEEEGSIEEDGEIDDGDDDGGGLVDDVLCEGMRKISVNGEKTMPKFTGRHTRFVYNSDDDLLEGEEECGGVERGQVSGILRSKGLPTPKGKHLRFPEELEE